MPRVKLAKLEQGTSSSSSGNPTESAPSSTNHTDSSAAKAFSKSQTSALEDYIQIQHNRSCIYIVICACISEKNNGHCNR